MGGQNSSAELAAECAGTHLTCHSHSPARGLARGRRRRDRRSRGVNPWGWRRWRWCQQNCRKVLPRAGRAGRFALGGDAEWARASVCSQKLGAGERVTPGGGRDRHPMHVAHSICQAMLPCLHAIGGMRIQAKLACDGKKHVSIEGQGSSPFPFITSDGHRAHEHEISRRKLLARCRADPFLGPAFCIL